MAAAPLPMHVRRNFWIGIDKVTKHADLDPLELSKRARQEVEWFCHQRDSSLFIRFPKAGGMYRGSPFSESEFVIPKGGSVLSGPPINEADGIYKYDVYEYDSAKNPPIGEQLLDPQIIIKD